MHACTHKCICTHAPRRACTNTGERMKRPDCSIQATATTSVGKYLSKPDTMRKSTTLPMKFVLLIWLSLPEPTRGL